MFFKALQQGLNFVNLPLLGSCTYSHSYCPEAPNARVKYVAHRALVSQVLVNKLPLYLNSFLSCSTRNLTLASLSLLFTIKIDVFPLFASFNSHSGLLP